MREIKFRGKDLETGEWVYGSLFQSLGEYPAIAKPKPTADCKLYYCLAAVNPDTVGQYTGLKDMDRKEIYEGDLLLSVGMVWEVVYDENLASFVLCTEYGRGSTPLGEMIRSFGFKISGNIHDNPGMLEGEK